MKIEDPNAQILRLIERQAQFSGWLWTGLGVSLVILGAATIIVIAVRLP